MSSLIPDCNQDTVLPFHMKASPVRGRIARLSGTLDDLINQHCYPEPVNTVLAEAVILTALIGQLVNLGWKFSLQFRSDGPLRLVAADYMAPQRRGEAARVRAYASLRQPEADISEECLVARGQNGYLAMLIDKGDGREPYKGLSPIAGDTLSKCAEQHFLQSEQIPTRLFVATGLVGNNGRPSRRAGGIMIQRLPDASDAGGNGRGQSKGNWRVNHDESWAKATAIASTVGHDELLGPEPSLFELVYRLYHEDVPLVTEHQEVEFGCSCSAERVRRSLSIYSSKDIASMTTKDKVVTADCQFCGAHYELDPSELGIEAATNE